MKRKIKKKYIILNTFLILVFIIFVISFFYAESKNTKIDKMIVEFKKEAVLDEKKSDEQMKYYKVSRETKEKRSAFYDEAFQYPGNLGDIIVELDSPYYIPVVRELQTTFVGGHALFSYGNQILEITGNIFRTDNKVQFLENEYLTNEGLKTFLGLRVKDMQEEDYKKLDQNLREEIGKKYNYFYLFNTKNKYYCTDFVSRAYEKLDKGYNLNEDKGLVTVQDLVVSKDTYIYMFKERNKDGTFNVYYLE